MESFSPTFTIDVRRLEVLRELDRRGTVTATGRALHLTPSAVSQQLAALSREAGVPLLERHGRRVRLTGQARILLGHAEQISRQLELARVELAEWSDGRRGAVTIGAFSSAISGLVAEALRQAASTQPDVALCVIEAEPPDLFTRLDRGDVDLAVAVDFAAAPPHTDRRYVRTELLVDTLDLAVATAHPLATIRRIPLRELATERWIAGDARSCCGAITRSVCAANGFTPDIRHATNDWRAVAELVAAGAGVALIPRLAQPRRPEGIVLRPVASPAPTRNIFAAVRAGMQHDPVLVSVLDQLAVVAARVNG